MKLYNFDLLAYPDTPSNAPGTPIPSTYFAPSTGARNYPEHIDEMAYCEALGFDGVVFNEHHYSAYGTMASPNLIAAALSQRPQHMKIGVLGNILPLRQHPVRVAEEYAMLDVLRYFFSLWNQGFNEAASHARAALNTEHLFTYFREGNRERVNFHPLSWDDLGKTGFILAGSPDIVARKLKQQMR